MSFDGRQSLHAAQKGGAVKSFLSFFAGLALLVIVVLGAGGYLAWREANRPGPAETKTVVLLKSGSSVATIAHELEDSGVIRYTDFFTGVVRVRRVQNDLKAGEYEIPAGASVMQIIDILVEGKSILHRLTTPEGLTTAQILRIISGEERLEGDITLTPGEGRLLPETYAYTRGETRDAIVRRMMKAQDALMDELWPDRALELPFSTREEAVILASIVEKETAVEGERGRIAAVFVNRLKRGMRLESDPTIIYGLTAGEPLGRGLRQSELRKETPYNTYIISGLPPTPIGNPGRASLEAVLNPTDTDDLFFVADGTGGHAFAATHSEHERNVAAWRRIERERRENQ